MFKAFYIFLIIAGVAHANYAQEHAPGKKQYITPEDSIKLAMSISHSSAAYFQRSDSFAKLNDSISAGMELLKVDPYYIIGLHKTPADISESFTKLRLTHADAAKYRAIFIKAYNEQKSKPYLDFKRMYEEDQGVRQAIFTCADSMACDSLSRAMHLTDSLHFKYLRAYAQKYGWPTMHDGNMFADIIAIHDHDYHEHYIPLMVKQALKSDYPCQVLAAILALTDHGSQKNSLEKIIKEHNYRKFYVDDIVHMLLPSNFNEIQQAVRELCPASVIWAIECSDNKDFSGFMNKNRINARTSPVGELMNKVLCDLAPTCPKGIPVAKPNGYGLTALTAYHWSRQDNVKPRLVLHVISNKKTVK